MNNRLKNPCRVLVTLCGASVFLGLFLHKLLKYVNAYSDRVNWLSGPAVPELSLRFHELIRNLHRRSNERRVCVGA